MLHFVKECDKGEKPKRGEKHKREKRKKEKREKETRLSLKPEEEEHVADVNIKH
jgi:hypothetical protein